MTTERRQAPRRAVASIERTGGWGQVRYLHHLECGHVESRARSSRAPKLGCAMCLKVNKVDEMFRTEQKVQKDLVDSVDVGVITGQDEIRIEQMIAVIASKLGVPREAISVNTMVSQQGNLEVQSGLIFLSADDVTRMGGQ